MDSARALWTTAGQKSAPRAQLAALDPPPDGAAGAGVEDDEGLEELSLDDDELRPLDDDELSLDDDDEPSDAEALLRLSVR